MKSRSTKYGYLFIYYKRELIESTLLNQKVNQCIYATCIDKCNSSAVVGNGILQKNCWKLYNIRDIICMYWPRNIEVREQGDWETQKQRHGLHNNITKASPTNL